MRRRTLSRVVPDGVRQGQGERERRRGSRRRRGLRQRHGDPQKQFCVTLPAAYKVDPKIDSDALYAELIRFTGDNMGDGMTITLGAASARTYEAAPLILAMLDARGFTAKSGTTA